MTTDPIFGDIDAVATPEAGESYGDRFTPPAGSHVTTLGPGKFFRNKKGELTGIVEFILPSTESWSDVTILTKDGVPQEDRIKRFKVLMRTLGLNGDAPASTYEEQLMLLDGRRAYVDVVHKAGNDGVKVFVNTYVTGMDPATPQPVVGPPTQDADLPWTAPAVDPAPPPVAAPAPVVPPVAAPPVDFAALAQPHVDVAPAPANAAPSPF